MGDMTAVRCLNEWCEQEFETTQLKVVTDIVTCPHCKAEHKLDEDFGDDSNFWYLHSIKQKTGNI